MEIKDWIMTGLGLLIALISYAYLRDIKGIKKDLDETQNDITNHVRDNTTSHEKIWIEVHRIDKEQGMTKTIVERCPACKGDTP